MALSMGIVQYRLSTPVNGCIFSWIVKSLISNRPHLILSNQKMEAYL